MDTIFMLFVVGTSLRCSLTRGWMWKKKHIFYFLIRMRDDDVGVEDNFMRG